VQFVPSSVIKTKGEDLDFCIVFFPVEVGTSSGGLRKINVLLS